MTKSGLFIAALPGFENVLETLQKPENMKALCDTIQTTAPQPAPNTKPSGMDL